MIYFLKVEAQFLVNIFPEKILNDLKVTADRGKNRLNLILANRITKRNLGELYTELRFCVPDLKTGFDVVSDLSNCSFAFLDIIPTFKNILNYLLSNGSGEMVCVLKKNTLIYKQIQLATIFQGYKPAFVSTLEEAEEKLAASKKRSTLRFSLHKQTLKYSSGDGEQKALLDDVSVGGCSINAMSHEVSLGDELSLTLAFFQDENLDTPFKILSEVVRVEDDLFAVKFMDLDDDKKKILWDNLIQLSQQKVGLGNV